MFGPHVNLDPMSLLKKQRRIIFNNLVGDDAFLMLTPKPKVTKEKMKMNIMQSTCLTK